MPIFISEDDLAAHANDTSYVATKADDFIRVLQTEIETVKAAADAASITAEQTCSLLEHKFVSLFNEYSKLETEKNQLQASLDERLSELADIQANKHQLHLQSIGKDGEIERLNAEVSELHKLKRQLVELVQQKDSEISEKNATINTYLDRIVVLTDNGMQKETRLSETVAEMTRVQATCSRLSQEKELIERHNAWLNDELTSKVDNLLELRKAHAKLEEDMSTKIGDLERQFNECSTSLKWKEERTKKLESLLSSLQEELCSCKDAAAANEERLSGELSTVNKLVELYKESSEEWSRKAGELEGVIKALETHSSQVENDYKNKLEKEASARKQFEKEAADLKNKLERCEAEIESSRKANELNLISSGNLTMESWMPRFVSDVTVEDNNSLVPKIPAGVSGTALAASLLRDGWSLAKMYAKYQEAVDALRHEQMGRKESEAVLQRVLYELEEKAGILLDERAEYDRMVESYSVINQKLQHSISEQATLERTIQELKADLKRREREYNLAKKESVDLERQVAILLKECRDLQLRGGSNVDDQIDDQATFPDVEMSEPERVIPQQLLTFKDINGLVEQNAQLRTLVRSLSDQIENKEKELMEKYEMELSKQNDEAASRVAAVLKRAEEQGNMIEALHTSVAMYKRLYEEEQKLRSSYPHSLDSLPVTEGQKDFLYLLEGHQQAAKKVQEKTSEQLKSLEQDLAKARNGIASLRSERDKLTLDAKFAGEKLDSFMKEFDYQRNEKDRILSRNIEFQQLIVDFQRKLQESSEAKIASEELQRKLSMEVSILKNEKEMLSNAERRACNEVRKLSERVHQLQASLDTIQSAQEVREETRAAERRKQEEYIKQLEKEWADAKKELQQERDAVRALTSEREQTLKNAMSQVEEIRKELTTALHATSSAETRAAVAESKLSDLENKIRNSDLKAVGIDDIGTSLSQSEVDDLHVSKEEVIKLKEEARINKEHMQQYKSIAQVNEAALKQMEAAHENFKSESEKLKKSLEAEISSLRKKISELEEALSLKTSEVVLAGADKEEALASALAKITSLKEESSNKDSQINLLEIQLSGLKEDLEKEHERWRSAQANYERQVILQSETIQELTKTSQALAALREGESELRKLADALKCENNELKTKWETEKSVLEKTKNEAENRYNELNEQNKILHSRLEALHIQLAEKDRSSAGTSSGSTITVPSSDAGLQNVVSYLRRSKEIAETEISLLKQEKLRLQSQLERAIKDAETAQATLQAERTNSRALLFSEEDIKSLQLQVSEINLLRESNMQLREENKHNFEECQKLRELANKVRTEKDNTESRLRERETEIEALKKEIEMEKIAKSHLEIRVSELLEKGKNIDLQEYNQMKDQISQMQEKLREKDAEIEEIKSVMSKQQETMSKLEQDLKTSEAELGEREKRINAVLQIEAFLKSELEKQKKITAQWKKKYDSFSKEKEELSKEKQALLKQIEDLKHSKKLAGGASGEQILKEKEEKDHRIQILEKTLERQREELRKEREDHKTEKAKHQNTEKAMIDSVRSVDQLRANFESKLEKHKNALKQLSEGLEKVKHAETDLPEGTSVVQILSGTILDDLAGAYASAVENFEMVAHSISIDLGVTPPVDTPQEIPAATSAEPAIQATIVPPGAPTSNVAPKAAETKERRPLMAKTSVETRRTGRKLVRPRLVQPEEPQGDTEMSDVDGSSTVGKPTPPLESESQRTGQPRKRIASSAPELNEQSFTQGEGSSDIEPATKRAKESEPSQEIVQGFSAAPDIPTTPGEEPSEITGDLLQGSNEDGSNEKEQAETDADPLKESELGGVNEGEPLNEKNDATEENLDKPSGSQESDDGLKDQTVEDSQPSATEIESDREEGELLPDAGEFEEAADGTNIIGSPSNGKSLNQAGTSPLASPLRTEDETLGAGAEPGEINSPEPLFEEKNDEGEGGEEAAEASDKIPENEGADQAGMEADKTPEDALATETTASTTTEAEPSKQVTPSTAQSEEVKQPSPVSHPSTIVNLSERARQRAALRQSGSRMFSPQSRGQGRVLLRDRGGSSVRGGRVVRGRGGRGQPGGQQG